MAKPIPAYYCCYLLRAIDQPRSLYIGSTPNPKRRLEQHNGLIGGGAARTARDKSRPWQMACHITGFPSKIGALQFEWAWNNNHKTKHIPDEDRMTSTAAKQLKSPVKRKLKRPRMSAADLLGSAQLLLLSPVFARWPLRVVIFCPDIFDLWQTLAASHVANLIPVELRDNSANQQRRSAFTKSLKDDRGKIVIKRRQPDDPGNGLIDDICVRYDAIQEYCVKTQDIIEEGTAIECEVCGKLIKNPRENAAFCVHNDCSSGSHTACLAQHFDSSGIQVLPSTGSCPRCRRALLWADVMKEWSLRSRDPASFAETLQPTRKKHKEAMAQKESDPSETEPDSVATRSESDENVPSPSAGLSCRPIVVADSEEVSSD